MVKKSQQQNHLDYWTKRQEDILRFLDQADIDMSLELSKVYREQAFQAQKDLFEFYQRYAEDNNMTYQDVVKKLTHEDLSDYRENAERYRKQAEKDPELLKRINEQYVSAKATRLDALHLDLLFKVGIMKGIIDKSFESYLKSASNYAYKKAVGGRVGTLNTPALNELVNTPFNGYNYSEQLWGNVDNLVRDLKDTLKKGFVRGDNPRSLARDLAKKYDVAKYRAETLLRTDGTMIINNATAKRYIDSGLKYYRDLVRLDGRTTEICKRIARLNERKLLSEMKPGVNAAPYHYNCRTTIIPDDDEISAKELKNLESSRYSQDMTNQQSSGAISERRGSINKQQDAFAERYYNQLRNSKRDVVIEKMSASSGVDKEIVRSALSHVLDNTYQLWDCEELEYRDRNFYPHYDMARSFQRLILGNPKESDIIMLRHESLEAFYMNDYKMKYDDAHKLANEKYNYQEADRNG